MAYDWLHQTNFAFSTVAVELATGGLVLEVATGEGARFPSGATADHFQLVLWAASEGSPSGDVTREIVHAHYKEANKYDITRAQESTTAKTWVVGSKVAMVLTARYLSDIEGLVDALPPANTYFSAADTVLGRATAGAGAGEEIACTASARSIMDDASVGAIRTTLGVGTTDTVTLGGLVVPGYMNRNAIINGAMDIWQRGTATLTDPASGTFFTDRFSTTHVLGDGTYNLLQSAETPAAGFPFQYSLKLDCTHIETAVASSELCFFRYKMEGYDFKRFEGEVATLSFWVKAVKTGIYCVSFRNGAVDKSYVH